MLNTNFDWGFLNKILGAFYNFFGYLVNVLQTPFNDPFHPFSFYNPYLNTTVSVGIPEESFPEWLNFVFDIINGLTFDVFNLFLQPFGIDTSYPFWICALCLIPALFVSIFLFNLVMKLLPTS